MKSTSAKQKRTAKVLQTMQLVKKEITDKYSTASSYQQALNEIDTLGLDS